MLKKLFEGYRTLLISKAEGENWKIVVETDTDKKLFDTFIQDEKLLPKGRKKISMESLVFIVFGKTNLEQVLKNGLEEYQKYEKPESENKKKKTTKKKSNKQ